MPCSKHSNPIVTSQCIRCQRDLCPDCIKEFGYYCSDTCRLEAQKENKPLLTQEEKKKLQEIDRRAKHLTLWVVWIIPSFLLLGLTIFILSKTLDRSGKVRWEIPLEEAPLILKSDRGVLYALFGSNQMKAFEIKTGKPIWESKFKGLSKLFPFLEIVGSRAIIANQKKIFHINLKTGKISRKLRIRNKMVQAPVKIGKKLFILEKISKSLIRGFTLTPKLDDFQLICLNTLSLKKRWASPVQLLRPGKIIINRNRIYIFDYREMQEKKLFIHAWDRKTGKWLWQKEFETYFFNFFEPVVGPEGILVISQNRFHYLDSSGDPRWEYPFFQFLSSSTFTTEGHPIILWGEKMTCYRKENGETLWQFEVGPNEGFICSESKMVYAVGSVATKSHRRNYFPQKLSALGLKTLPAPPNIFWLNRLYAISSESGKIIWSKDGFAGKPFFYKKNLYLIRTKFFTNFLDAGKFLGEMSSLTCFKPSNGSLLWRYQGEGSFNTLEISKEGIFFVRYSLFFAPGDLFRGPKDPAEISLVCLYS